MGLKERFQKEMEEMTELLAKIMNYHEIVKGLKDEANKEENQEN